MPGLAKLVSSLVDVANKVTATLQVETQIFHKTGLDRFGKPTYATVPVIVNGSVEQYERIVPDMQGKMVQSRFKIGYARPLIVNSDDKVEIPGTGSGIVISVTGAINPETNEPYAPIVILA